MLHCPKINGAPMAQSDLLHHWNFPRAGDGAKPRAITPCTRGAPMAQQASRAPRPTAMRRQRSAYGDARSRTAHRVTCPAATVMQTTNHGNPCQSVQTTTGSPVEVVTMGVSRARGPIRKFAHRPICRPSRALPWRRIRGKLRCGVRQPCRARTNPRPSLRPAGAGGYPLLRTGLQSHTFLPEWPKATAKSHGRRGRRGFRARIQPRLSLCWISNPAARRTHTWARDQRRSASRPSRNRARPSCEFAHIEAGRENGKFPRRSHPPPSPDPRKVPGPIFVSAKNPGPLKSRMHAAPSSECVAGVCMFPHVRIRSDLRERTMSKPKEDQISVRLDLELRAAVERAAEAEQRSVSGQIRYFVASAIEARAQAPQHV